MILSKIKKNNIYANKFVESVHLVNIIKNSSFETNEEWMNVVYDATEHLYGARSSKFAGGSEVVLNSQNTSIQPILNHVYYGRHYKKTSGNATPSDCRFEWYNTDSETGRYIFGWNNGNFPDWTMESAINTVTGITGTYYIRNFTVNTNVDVFCDGLMIIDLTEAFGAGKEPNQTWCDENIPYFEGEYDLPYEIIKIDSDGIYVQTFNESEEVIKASGADLFAQNFIECLNFENLVPDGDMKTNGWNLTAYASYDSNLFKYGTRSMKISAPNTVPEDVVGINTLITLDNTHLYYARMECYQEQVIGGCGMYWPIAEPTIGFATFAPDSANKWTLYSWIVNRTSFTNGDYQLRVDFDNGYQAGTVWIDGVMLIDLTATFGQGNEPSREWCDQNIPFFENKYELEFDGNSWLF